MNWQDQFFIYCERGLNPAFWAEPLNAISNVAFFAAALLAFLEYRRVAARSYAELLLIGLVALISIGSFLFHTTATRWAVIADTAPIGIFMLAYSVYAVRRFLALRWPIATAFALLYVVIVAGLSSIPCPVDLLPNTLAAGRGCINGSGSYLPALLALILLSAALVVERHPARITIIAATATFTASIILRTLDIEVCAATEIAGRRIGTHFLWHLLNAATLYLLLLSALRNGRPVAQGAATSHKTP